MNTIPLILLDLDETLVDTTYRINCDAKVWSAALRVAESKGAVIGLNSDSPIETLETAAALYGITGPIIAERGALVKNSPESQLICTVDEAKDFPAFRLKIISALLNSEIPTRYLTIIGDVNHLSKRLPALTRKECTAERVVLINGLRRCSFSCFVRERVGTEWEKTEKSLDEMIAFVHGIGDSLGSLWNMRDVERNPTYGFLGVHHKHTKKSIAVNHLPGIAEGRPIYMIGNSMSDWLDDERVIHCAVANATSTFKARCRYIAKNEMTLGVMELIEQIVG